MRKKLLALVLAIIPMLGFSQHRSETDAITIAQEFWDYGTKRAKLKAVSQNRLSQAKARTMTKAATAPTNNCKQSFYVINDEEHNRFVIVSSDDRLYKILELSSFRLQLYPYQSAWRRWAHTESPC